MRDVTWRAPAPRWRRNPPVGFIRPCEPALTDRPPAGLGWLHEVKHDEGVDRILFSEALAAEGAVVFAKACELGLEGIVSKHEGSFYKSGRSRNWLKTINPDFVST